MKRTFFTAVFAATLLIAGQAFALDLSQARAQGLVGEKQDGYVAVVKPSPDVQAVVNDVNARRKAEYARISAQNGQPVSVVGKIAAEKIINGLPSGSLYQGAGGGWTSK